MHGAQRREIHGERRRDSGSAKKTDIIEQNSIGGRHWPSRRNREAYLSAEHAPPEEDPWLQGTHADASRQGNNRPTPAKGPGQAHALGSRKDRSMEKTLRSAAEFARVMRKGKILTTPDVVIHILDREDSAPGRFGLVVAKKNRGAVARNRAKRQLRAAIRLAGGIPEGYDSVFVLRRGRAVDVGTIQPYLWQILARFRSGDSETTR
jgi:ribonuclease P protein component